MGQLSFRIYGIRQTLNDNRGNERHMAQIPFLAKAKWSLQLWIYYDYKRPKTDEEE